MSGDGQKPHGDDWEQTLHDLRDALHGIQCGVDLLMEMPMDVRQQRVLSMVRQDHDTARRLVQRLASKIGIQER